MADATNMKWFDVPVSPGGKIFLHERLARLGFMMEPGAYRDAQGRQVALADGHVRIGIPTTDVIGEQEQLEFIASNLGLDVDLCVRV